MAKKTSRIAEGQYDVDVVQMDRSLDEKSDEVYSVPEVSLSEKRLVAKIDTHLLPAVCVLYLASAIDRVNIGNAVLFGLEHDLGITNRQFNNCILILFVPACLAEIPANILLKKLKPHVWLSLCMFLFGLVTITQGLTTGYSGLLTARFFLGLFEAGILPGCLYLLSMWYRRDEFQKRVTFFFCATSLASTFGGLLASAIGNMDGVCGLKAWRWVFVLEGLATCVLGLIWFFVIPDFPENARFLTEKEQAAVKARLNEDVGEAALSTHHTLRTVFDTLCDYRVYLGGWAYFGLIVPGYGYSYFAPTIIKGLGYTAIQAQLRSVPPSAVTLFVAMTMATVSDRLRHRWLCTVGMLIIAIAGFIMLLTIHADPRAQYAGLFLISSGVTSTSGLMLCWFSGNLSGHRRRAIGTAWFAGFGNIGGFIAAYTFPASDAPHYTMGYSIGLAFTFVALLSGTVYAALIKRENEKRDKDAAEGAKADVAILTAEEQAQMGDLNPTHRYMI